MNTVHRIIAIALCSGLLASAAFAQEPTIEETPQDVVKYEESILTSGNTMIVVEESKVGEVRNLVAYLLQSGRSNAQSGNLERSAEAFTLASAYMHVDAGRGQSRARTRVVEEADLMKELAGMMTAGSKTEMRVVDQRIFGAHRALASYHQDRAMKMIREGYNRQAGHALEAAIVHYDHAAWAHARANNTEVSDEVNREVEDMANIATTLKQAGRSRGEQTASDDTVAKVRSLGQHIRSLGRAG
ncbi:hypothetical protein CRI94_00520 [Longibacter salinarum]|uniref:Secreted protein n=1 Tax=Longibacter salinarum TaxID=1850348 RepID=A0A2A8D1Q3_9BACT|nr:hypothetical protein [Longibacter salinarum]PEN14814.1 hypothetical protein CRI94_00520 [Longibacter salinarum]